LSSFTLQRDDGTLWLVPLVGPQDRKANSCFAADFSSVCQPFIKRQKTDMADAEAALCVSTTILASTITYQGRDALAKVVIVMPGGGDRHM